MRSRIPSQIRWTGHKTMDELLDDPLAESLYGLFLKVKDSPRHISFKPENLINEVYYICNRFYQDPDPCSLMTDYEREIESDMGWRYATDLVMTMAYIVMIKQRKTSKKIQELLTIIERSYRGSQYWRACQVMIEQRENEKRKPRRVEMIPMILQNQANLKDYLGKQPIVIINNVEQLNAVLGNNAKIQK